VVQAAAAAGRSVTLVTTEPTAGSTQFQAHLADYVLAGDIDVQLRDRVTSVGGLFAELVERGRSTTHLVLPEVDRILLLLAALRLSRLIPSSTVAIVMRPPRLRYMKSLFGFGGAAKLALLYLLAALLDLRLLEDPLATGADRCWTMPVLRRQRFRLDDPSLLDGVVAKRPPELANFGNVTPVVTMCGSIDERKGLTVTLAAWGSQEVNQNCLLLVAGKQSTVVKNQLLRLAALPSNVIFIDRYMTNAELRWVIARSRALLVLSELHLSSGILLASASAGRLVIAAEGTRIGRIAVKHRFGIQSALEPTALAAAVVKALDFCESPPRLTIPTLSTFGRSVLPTSWSTVHEVSNASS
jgi:hypothetical protein